MMPVVNTYDLKYICITKKVYRIGDIFNKKQKKDWKIDSKYYLIIIANNPDKFRDVDFRLI